MIKYGDVLDVTLLFIPDVRGEAVIVAGCRFCFLSPYVTVPVLLPFPLPVSIPLTPRPRFHSIPNPV